MLSASKAKADPKILTSMLSVSLSDASQMVRSIRFAVGPTGGGILVAGGLFVSVALDGQGEKGRASCKKCK